MPKQSFSFDVCHEHNEALSAFLRVLRFCLLPCRLEGQPWGRQCGSNSSETSVLYMSVDVDFYSKQIVTDNRNSVPVESVYSWLCNSSWIILPSLASKH
jgi:hypothetical protein